MPSYSFKLTLKEELGMFGKSSFVSDMKYSCVRYNQFVFGKNIRNVKSVKIDGVNVNVTLNLINNISDKDFEDAISNVVKLMKQKGYSLKKGNNKPKKKSTSQTKKMKTKSKKGKTRKSTQSKNNIFGIKLW
jgi:hypothetical protein